AAPIAGHTSVSSDDVNAFKAPTLLLGGTSTFYKEDNPGTGAKIYFDAGGTAAVNLLDGATIRAGQVFLVAKTIGMSGG
ncbi:hypothetical protein ABTD13_18360, partial [Acinetobacter baumannii]